MNELIEATFVNGDPDADITKIRISTRYQGPWAHIEVWSRGEKAGVIAVIPAAMAEIVRRLKGDDAWDTVGVIGPQLYLPNENGESE